jgi:hypothetical protein
VPSLVDAFRGSELKRTELGLYQPLSAGRELTSLRIAKTENGTCEPESRDDIVNTNAARCQTATDIYDPCYAFLEIAAGESLVCVFAPWAREATVVKVTRVDPSSFTSEQLERERKRARPWALELENGLGCLFVGGGGTTDVAGRRINYVCWRKDEEPGPRNARGEVAGEPDRSGAVWRIQFSETGSTQFREVSIKRVWY